LQQDCIFLPLFEYDERESKDGILSHLKKKNKIIENFDAEEMKILER